MSIYIISNRKINGQEFNNDDDGIEKAQHDFRVAEVTVKDDENSQRAENFQSVELSYKILPDNKLDDYSSITELIKDAKENGKLDNSSSRQELMKKVNEHAGTAAMFANLYIQMLFKKESNCLFFIHGYDCTFKDSLKHIKKLYRLYIKPKDSGIDHLIYVSWPSKPDDYGPFPFNLISLPFRSISGSIRDDYRDEQEDAEETGMVLGRLFNKLLDFFRELFKIEGMGRCSNKIHLAAHSMGNTVLDYMIQHINDKKLFSIFGEILLLNSDVRDDIFEDDGSFTKLDRLGVRTHIYINQSDDVLEGSKSLNSKLPSGYEGRRLGYRGPKNPESLDNGTFVVDTTDVGDTGEIIDWGSTAEHMKESNFDHSGYIGRELVVEDILQVLKGKHETKIKGRQLTKRNYFELNDK